MRARQGSVLETLRRVQGFLDANDGLFGALNKSGARTTLDRAIAQLTSHAVDQDAGRVNSKGETARQRALRLSLRQAHMRAIAAVARAKLRDVPEFQALELPDARMTSARLIAAAGSMAEAATKHEQVFVDAGLPSDFIAALLGAADAVKGSIDGRAQNRGRRVGATAGLAAEEKQGRNVVKVLDALVVPALGTNDSLIAEWRSLKRVSPRSTPTPVAPTTSPAPTSQAA